MPDSALQADAFRGLAPNYLGLVVRVDFGTSLSRWSRRLAFRILKQVKIPKDWFLILDEAGMVYVK
ncbi:MAG TPA: hypothetical protein VLQ20_10170, partial [Planococcus sp. (in: firmicutes)]|nr:hypothetical protein [Planococcus sp. (in: firmicutes)]